jgi:hypothetical protein
VLDAVLDFDLNLPGLPSLVLTDLSEFATLAFLASFDVPDINTSSDARKPPRRVTYIGMAKRVMPTVVEIYTRFKTSVDIYEDGTLDRMLSVSERNELYVIRAAYDPMILSCRHILSLSN